MFCSRVKLSTATNGLVILLRVFLLLRTSVSPPPNECFSSSERRLSERFSERLSFLIPSYVRLLRLLPNASPLRPPPSPPSTTMTTTLGGFILFVGIAAAAVDYQTVKRYCVDVCEERLLVPYGVTRCRPSDIRRCIASTLEEGDNLCHRCPLYSGVDDCDGRLAYRTCRPRAS